MARLPGTVSNNHTGGRREAAFWILLLGSWMMLNSPAWPNQWLGAIGAVSFLCFAFGSLGALRNGGMEYARWEPVPRRFWLWAVAVGLLSGLAAMGTAYLAHQRIAVASDWRMFLLQVALGPVLEEVVFRGYLIHLLLWIMRALGAASAAAAIATSALTFASFHVIQPGSGWKEFAVICVTGTLYGCVRVASGSTGPAAIAHTTYNLAAQLSTWMLP